MPGTAAAPAVAAGAGARMGWVKSPPLRGCAPPGQKEGEVWLRRMASFGKVWEPASAQPIAKPAIPPTPAFVPKSAKEKITILTEATADA